MPRYAPDPKSLRAHPVPAWFEDAKFGIFVHWSLSCIPTWAPRRGSLVDILRADPHDFQKYSPYAVRARGMRFGVYYSGGLDWTFEPRPIRGLAHSFGMNDNEDEANLLDPAELVRSFVDIVANNGNLLLNVGPTREGVIHPREASRLETLGAWLAVNGEAIYATRPWRRAADLVREWPADVAAAPAYAVACIAT